ncbi:MAG: HAMP domain-containing histidine kinase [Bacteroidales bacterium]|nr:HAMP domain-containing histidine kinase [Bacteroidales bacterium]
MKKNKEIINLRYKRYITEITAKRLKTLMPVAVIIFSLLIVSDIFIRHSIYAVYSRLIPIFLALFLYFYNILCPKFSTEKTVLYNIFLASIPTMMYAKYLIHYGTGTETTNIIGIIVTIFIISMEVRANLLNSLLIYLVPPIFFAIILLRFYPVTTQEWQSLINILLALVIGFFINYVQNNFRFKAYQSNNLLSIEKYKLEKAIDELNKYKNKLEDMVEKKTLTLKYALEKAKESDALKTQFLLNISHELRTPMNAVIGFNDLIVKKNPKFKKEYQIIEQNLNILLATIENIILLSQLQSGQASIEISIFSLQRFNYEIFNKLKEKVDVSAKPIKVKFNTEVEENLFLKSDKEKCKIIFSHIIDNAVKYTEKGSITLLCKKENNNLEYTISDTGIGISDEELPFIFDTFRKIEKKDKLFSGTGIGLSITKNLISLLNGNISVKSIQNKGTVITVILPISV